MYVPLDRQLSTSILYTFQQLLSNILMASIMDAGKTVPSKDATCGCTMSSFDSPFTFCCGTVIFESLFDSTSFFVLVDLEVSSET